MWSSWNAEEEEYMSLRSTACNTQNEGSECSSSSESDSTGEGASPGPSSPLASPSSSSSPQRPSPLSDFLTKQLHQPVINSLKTWIQGDETTLAAEAPTEEEDRWGPGLWAWCLGGDGERDGEHSRKWDVDASQASKDKLRGLGRLEPTSLADGPLAERARGFEPGQGQEAQLRRRRRKSLDTCEEQEAEVDSELASDAFFIGEHHRRLEFSPTATADHASTSSALLEPPRCAGSQAEEYKVLPIREGRLHSQSVSRGPTGGSSSHNKERAPPASKIPDATASGLHNGDNAPKVEEEAQGGAKAPAVQGLNLKQKLWSFAVRSASSLWMVGGFALLAYLGHIFMWGLVITLQVTMVYEILELARQHVKGLESSAFPSFLDWHFVLTAMVYMYGHLLQDQIQLTAEGYMADVWPAVSTGLLLFNRYHSFICYALYLTGLVCFVLLLREGQYEGQFARLAWNHLVVILIVLQSSFFAPNIFQGFIWFLLPCSLVIMNDCGAYMFGFFLGRTSLIRISPKKTWEGFLGGALVTTVAAFLLGGTLQKFKWLVCPRLDISWGTLNCKPDPIFEPHLCSLPESLFLPEWARSWDVSYFQGHAVVLAIFASFVAPFGGFFASGLKRALKIKDFGNIIPGHGGVTDRMDCQTLMAAFSYVYLHTFVVMN